MKNGVKIVGNCIFIAYEGKLNIRSLYDIFFCESCLHYCEIYFDPVKILVDPNTISKPKLPPTENLLLNNTDACKPLVAPIGIHNLALLLPCDSFCMIHRHCIVYLGILKKATIEANKIMFDKYILNISRYNIEEFLEKLNKFRFPGISE